MTHPYLASPENAAAFAYLVANPSGSRARWAKGLGWSPSKVQRFIEALLRFRLAETEVLKGYNLTVFKPLVDPPVSARSASGPRADRGRTATGQPHLEASRSSSSVSRCGKAPANGGNAEAMSCIAVVNEVLGSNFGTNYTPISPDNYGSHRAVFQWIAAGMSLEDMTRLLRQKAAAFNPEKSGGDLPRSVGYFTRWMLKEWAIEKRQLPLPLMTVDRAPAQREKLSKPIPLSDVMSDVAAQLGVKR